MSIKDALELVDFAEVDTELEAWVDAGAWTTRDGPKGIFDDAAGWLAERRVLLAGVSTLARLVTPGARRGCPAALRVLGRLAHRWPA